MVLYKTIIQATFHVARAYNRRDNFDPKFRHYRSRFLLTMQILTVIPTPVERDHFLQACHDLGYPSEAGATGRLASAYFPPLDITVACGGLGKAQFGVQTQHLIDAAHWDLVICAGAAGALAEGRGRGGHRHRNH